MLFLALIMLLNPSANAQGSTQPEAALPAPTQAIVRNISLFRNEIQLDVKNPSKSGPIKVGSKFTAQTAVNHKCLLVVTRIVRDLAYADATQCPGYATLKKGQIVTASPEGEVNEEIRVVTPPAPKGETT